MRGKLYILGILLPLLIFFSSCEKEHCADCFKSTGPMSVENRNVEAFTRIRLSDRINLILHQDTAHLLKVEAGEHLLNGIITEVQEGVLYIRDENRCNWVRSFKNSINVYVNVAALREIYFEGSGEISSDNTVLSDTLEFNFWDASGIARLDVKCQEVRVHFHTGCGDAEISGETGSAYFYSRSNGQIRCSALYADYAYIDSKATGDAYIRASGQLDAKIAYTGNVYYWGKPPVIHAEINERGLLIPME